MRLLYLFLLLGVMSFRIANAQVGTICKWSDDKKAAVVLTFDDWSPGQYPIVVTELKKRNIIATFFPGLDCIAAWNHPWSTVIETVSYGNEVGNHSYSHSDLTTKSNVQLSTEIRKPQTIINNNITSQKVISFAYPMGAYNNKVIDSLIQSGHISARTVFNPSGKYYTYDFATQEKDYFEIRTFGMNGTISTASFLSQINNTIKGGGLLTYMYHSVDTKSGTYNDNWFAKVIQDSLQKQLNTLVSLKKSIWITTMSQAIKYHREARCAKLSEISAPNGKQWIIELTDTLSNNQLYNQPLSIKLKVNGLNYEIEQNNIKLSIDSVFNDTILFKAIPDGGRITLKAKGALAVNETPQETLKLYPIPATEVINIEFGMPFNSCQANIYDISGKMVKSFDNIPLNNPIILNISDLNQGTYIIQFHLNNNTIITRRIVIS